ncbi:MAG: UDP-N-acetylglucosamine pyrophosphorylase [Clostridia bacterium]|nr:UDP-N-acetylglucosamine pyrophosphorylase [Clostridia bacterium]
MLKTKDLFSLDKTLAGEYLSRFNFPWFVLEAITEIIRKIGKDLPEEEYDEVSSMVWVHKKALISPSAYIAAPAIICEGAEIRQGAFIRGSVLIGKDCVVGNSTEVKNSILFDGVQVPHYNYVGDSILGYKAHLGAGAVTSNVKSDKTNVAVRCDGEKIETGLRKFGAIIGDNAEIGCNSVLNPGTVIGKNSVVYPLSSVRGTVKENSIYKAADKIVEKRSE